MRGKMTRYLTIAQAAEYTGIAEKTLYRWIRERKMPGASKVNGCLRIDKAVLDKWFELNLLEQARDMASELI